MGLNLVPSVEGMAVTSHRRLGCSLTARAPSDDELPHFVIHEDEEGVGEGTEPPRRSGDRIRGQVRHTNQFTGRQRKHASPNGEGTIIS